MKLCICGLVNKYCVLIKFEFYKKLFNVKCYILIQMDLLHVKQFNIP